MGLRRCPAMDAAIRRRCRFGDRSIDLFIADFMVTPA